MANKQIRYGIGFDVDMTNLDQLRIKLNELAKITQKDLKNINPKANTESIKEMQRQIQTAAKEMEAALSAAYNPKLNTINIAKFNQQINAGTMSIKQMGMAFNSLDAASKNTFIDMTQGLFTTQREVKKTSSFLQSLGTTFVNTIKWSLASSAINAFTRTVSKAWNYVKDLDESLNNIRIVTDKSASSMEKFANKATKMAKELGSTTKAYTNASLIYYQQGLGEDDVQARTNVTIKAANVTGQSAAEVSEQLTAVWNGYKVVAEDAERYIDKLAAVAASTAADLEELSEGMSKVASGANAMGVNIDQLTAQLSTIISVTRQDASSVGTALKTIYARLGDLQVDGVDEFGVSLGDVSGKLQQVGVQVLDQEGNLRDMGDVMEEVAEKWGTWTAAQQQAIVVAMAGKRQYNNLLALFENWDMYETALSTSKNSEGTLEKQQETKLDSFEAKLNRLKATGEDVYNSIFDSDTMKGFIDVLTGLLEGINQFIKGIGGGGTLLLSLGSTIASIFSNQIAGGIANIVANLRLQRDEVVQNRAEVEMLGKYQELNVNQIKTLTDMYAKGLKMGDLMNEQEKKELDYLIQQTAELEKQKNIETEKQKNAENFYRPDKNSKGGQLTIAGQTAEGREKVASTYEYTAQQIEKESQITNQYVDFDKHKTNYLGKMKDLGFDDSEIKSVSEDYATQNNAWAQTGIDEYSETNIKNKIAAGASPEEVELLRQKQQLIKDINADQEKYMTVSNQTADAIKNLAENEHVSEETKKQLLKLIDKDGKLKVSLSTATTKLKTETKKLSNEYRSQADQVRKGKKAFDDISVSMEKVQKATKQLFKALDTKALIKGITKGISAVGQLGSALMSIKNIGDIISDKNMSGLEKFAQITSSIGMTLSMLSMSISGIKAAFNSFSIAIGAQNSLWGINKLLIKETDKEKQKAILTDWLLKNSQELYGKQLDETNAKMITEHVLQQAGGNLKDKNAITTNFLIKE